MAVKIRLTRHGSKKKPFYRIVVADENSPRDGKYIEAVGTYSTAVDPPKAELKSGRISYWIERGAVPTAIVGRIIKKAGIGKTGAKAA